jgi:hypothetical protein
MSIAFDSPGLDLLDRVDRTREPVHVQALVANLPGEDLDEAALPGLARPDEGQLHTLLERPTIRRSAKSHSSFAFPARFR